MSRSKGVGRGLLDLLLLAGLIVLVAMPTFAAEPSASPSASAAPSATATATEAPTTAPTDAPAATAAPTATAAPAAEPDEDDGTGKPEKSPKPGKADKAPEVEVTITGTVATRTDADGNTEYTTVAGGKTLVLEAGPSWFYGANHPLKPYVGKRVTITGEQRAGEAEVDVKTVNGTRLRAEGKPPWAGWLEARRRATSRLDPGEVGPLADEGRGQGQGARHGLLPARPVQGQARQGGPPRTT